MTRRVKLVLLVAALSAPAVPATALTETSVSSSDAWACAGVRAINAGVCLYNPIPHPDELPDLPTP